MSNHPFIALTAWLAARVCAARSAFCPGPDRSAGMRPKWAWQYFVGGGAFSGTGLGAVDGPRREAQAPEAESGWMEMPLRKLAIPIRWGPRPYPLGMCLGLLEDTIGTSLGPPLDPLLPGANFCNYIKINHLQKKQRAKGEIREKPDSGGANLIFLGKLHPCQGGQAVAAD